MRIRIYTYLALLFVIFSQVVNGQNSKYKLVDFFQYDSKLSYLTDSIYNSLSDTGRIAQMIITSAGELGKPESIVTQLAEDNCIGGVVFLRNSRKNHIKQINDMNNISAKNQSIGLLFSRDAEPRLFNGRILGSQQELSTIDIVSDDICDSITAIIKKELNDIGTILREMEDNNSYKAQVEQSVKKIIRLKSV